MNEAMNYKLPPHKIVSEWAEKNFVRFVSRSHGLATTETVSKSSLDDLVAYAIAAIEAQGVPDKTGTAYADLHAKWRKGRQELANLTRAHERLKAQGVSDGWTDLLKEVADNCLASVAESGITIERREYRAELYSRCMNMLASAPPAPQAKPQPLSADRDARIAELEQRNRDLYEDAQRFKEHALNEKAARLELERQLEEARKDAERYRWLRDLDEDPVMSLAAQYTDMNGSAKSISRRIDAAIDAAMQKGQS